MFKSIALITFFCFATWSTTNAQSYFLRDLVFKFPEYAKVYGLDPTNATMEPLLVQNGGIQAEFTDYQISGHSTARFWPTIIPVFFYLPYEDGDYKEPGLFAASVHISGRDLTLEGSYSLNGTWGSNVTVSGKGKWTTRLTLASQYDVLVQHNNVSFSEDKLYVTWDTSETFNRLYLEGTRINNLEGLSAEGHEEEITNAVMDSFFDSIDYDPFTTQLKDYLVEKILSTPISEMY